ncbi:CPBP family intramembrane metalloprotease [Pedobacter sp. CCM 8938]|uniref:CPBP family intramembrane metalloprotease n=1 Tax=Pedobacter fastidiosus TaxID=2765361 RepID=A0ABR7KWI0_9SPHI|nr:CPBP family intramembrane metalloprotease [Pedobacter fastidiosus]
MIKTLKSNRSVIIGVIFILALLFIQQLTFSPFLKSIGASVNATTLFISRLLIWFCLLLIWFYSIKFEKQKLLIWEEKNYNIPFYIISVILMFIIIIIGVTCIQKAISLLGLKSNSASLVRIVNIFKKNYWLMIFTALTAGIVEELIFRAYIQPRLELLFKSPAVAIIISSFLFGLLHFQYGTIINVLGPIFIGAVFAIHYWKFRNIKVLIFSHFLWDFILLSISLKR